MNELIWIVAGNYHEFRQYFYKKKRSGDNKDYRYVYGVDQLRGQENLKGFYIGTYRQRKDLKDIQDQIAISKREYRFVGQGIDWRGMAMTNPCKEILLPSTPSGNWFQTLYMDEYEATYSNQWTSDSGSNKTT